MKRIKLTVAYDGTHYSGWQIQPSAPTIEKELDTAIYALTGEKLHVTGASSAITHGTYRENWTLSVCGKRRHCLSGNTILKASAV